MTTSNIPIRVRCSGLCTVHCDHRDSEPGGQHGPGNDEIASILADIELIDWHLDAAAPQIYRQDPAASAELNEARALLNRFRRIAAGPASEGQEAVDALNEATGGNPRKGVIGDDDTILGELGDGAVANLLAIQSIVKDTDAAWAVFLAALAKARSRVPDGDLP
jgi:hypothetical protein